MSMIDRSHIAQTIAPTDQAAVVEAVRNAAQHGTPVYLIEGDSSETGDRPHLPERPGIGLCLASLDRVIDYPAADLTITVEAGMTLAELNKHLATQRQRLPIDVAQPERTTVGGAIAVNAAGPRRYAYGTMRDYLLGFTAIDGAGTLFSGGGRVVKNAAGYNMCRLMAGSFGTLAIITQATLMVRPVPEASALIACDLPHLDVAEKLLAKLAGSAVQPAAVELLAGCPGDNVPVLGPILDGSVGRLYVGFEGSSAEVEWMTAQLREQWNAANLTTPILASVPAAESHWAWLARAPSDVQLNVLPSAVVKTIVALLREAPNCTIQADAGDGAIFVDHIEESVAHKFLLTTTESCDNNVRRRVMRAIKDRFDPHNILNPGRFAYDSD